MTYFAVSLFVKIAAMVLKQNPYISSPIIRTNKTMNSPRDDLAVMSPYPVDVMVAAAQ